MRKKIKGLEVWDLCREGKIGEVIDTRGSGRKRTQKGEELKKGKCETSKISRGEGETM